MIMRFLFYFILLCNFGYTKVSAQTVYPETFHGNPNYFFGYWTFEKNAKNEIIDIAKNKYLGNIVGDCRFQNGRKYRYYPCYGCDSSWLDTTGETRTSLYVENGYGTIKNLPFDTKLYSFLGGLTMYCYVNLVDSSNGTILSLGNSVLKTGFRIICLPDTSVRFKYLALDLLENDSVLFSKKFNILKNEWVFIGLYLYNSNPDLLNNKNQNDLLRIYTFSEFKDHTRYGSEVYVKKTKDMKSAVPMNLGCVGEVGIGKDIFSGLTGSHFGIDDMAIDVSATPWYWVYDYLNETKSLKNNLFSISPNPCSNEIKIVDPNNLHYKTQYKIISSNGKVYKEGILSEIINVSELPGGIYFLQIENTIQKFIKEQ